MKLMNISVDACNELKDFLKENNIDEYKIRINLAGYGCSGPAFNITVDEATDTDCTDVVEGITFIADKSLADDFGGFIILSNEENEGRGLSLRPVIEEEGGCGSCNGCH